MTQTARVVQEAGAAAFGEGFRLRVVARTPSTQDVVRAAARGGAAAGFCCVAMAQSAGRGRQGRAWVAPPGTALLVSVLLRVRGDVVGGVPLCAGLAVVDAVSALGVDADRVGLKWPNDVLVDGRGKLAGVLAEVEPPHIVLGVGLNLAVEEFPPGAVGASLHQLLDTPPSWEEALAALLRSLHTRLTELHAGGIPATVDSWRRRAVGLGGPVQADTPSGPIRGTAVDIAGDGALLVETPSGITRLLAGDVHLLGS